MTAADDRADQIRARLAAATPGPWVLGAYVEGHEQVAWTDARAAEEGVPEWTVSAPQPLPDREYANAVLIAEMPADLTFLLAERDELLRRAEQAERAGAVKALRSVGMSDQADLIEMGRFTITGQPIVADLYDRTGQETKGIRQ